MSKVDFRKEAIRAWRGFFRLAMGVEAYAQSLPLKEEQRLRLLVKRAWEIGHGTFNVSFRAGRSHYKTATPRCERLLVTNHHTFRCCLPRHHQDACEAWVHVRWGEGELKLSDGLKSEPAGLRLLDLMGRGDQ